MAQASGKTNVRNISLGHIDEDPYIQSKQSIKRNEEEVQIISQLSRASDHHNIKKDEQDGEHLKAFKHIYNLFEIVANFVGIEMDFDWKPIGNIKFYFSVFLVAISWTLILYTQFFHINNGELMRVLEACSIYGVATSCMQKITGYVKHRYEILNLFFNMRMICRQTLPGNRADMLESHFIKTSTFLKLFAVGVVLCVGFFLACPIKTYIEDKELMSLLPLEIMFVDQTTFRGYVIANLIMITIGLYAAVAIVLYGAVFIFAVFMYALRVELIEQDLKDLDEMWADKTIVPLAYKYAYLKNICKKRQDLNKYIHELKRIFETKLFLYFCFNYFSQIICLFEVTKNHWTPGYAIALVLFIEMMFYCVMGTKITIADERLFRAIYATNWYTYDLYSQNIIVLLLHQSEKSNELQLGLIGPLNVITGISLGHVDEDPHNQSEQSFKRNEEGVQIISQLSRASDNPNFKKDEQDQEHFKAFKHIYNLFEVVANFVGIEMDFNWKPLQNTRFYFSVFLVGISWVFMLYTQFFHIKNGELLRVLEACSIYGVASSSTQKITGYVKHRYEILNLFFNMRRICRQALPGNRADMLESHFIKTSTFLKFFAVGVVLCVGFFLACPIKTYIEDKELMSLLPLEIMFVDQTTYRGYVIANLIMITIGLYAAVAIVLYGAVFIFAVFMYDLRVDLIVQDLKDLDEMWADKTIVPLAYKYAYLKNICKKRQDLNNYIDELKRIFQTKLFLYFCFNYFSQIICLFEVTKNHWTPGYAIALVLFIEMMFYCVMGTKITIADERLFRAIYATNWYTYDLYSQNIILLLIHHSEKSNELQLGLIGPLNVITGISVIKSIYSYYTIITELL